MNKVKVSKGLKKKVFSHLKTSHDQYISKRNSVTYTLCKIYKVVKKMFNMRAYETKSGWQSVLRGICEFVCSGKHSGLQGDINYHCLGNGQLDT